jgi:hypothetical protein
MSDNMSASVEEDKMLVELVEQIDVKLVEWISEHKIPPLKLIAVILARLTWLAKQGDFKEDFLQLLESPKEILENEDKKKQIH